jgi:hypothetical protein
VVYTADANRSVGRYRTYAVPSGSGGLSIDLDLSASNLHEITTGAWLRFILSASFTGSVKITPYIVISGVYYNGPSSMVTNSGLWKALDLGMLLLPPGGLYDEAIAGGYNNIYIGVTVVSADGLNFSVDYLQYCPADSYSVSKIDINPLEPINIRTDCHDGTVHVTDSFGAITGITSAGTLYGGIQLEPGLAQRLVFKFVENNSYDDMLANTLVRLFCWARKRTL